MEMPEVRAQSKTKNPTGPSTNGRSSAFGALCLGSNPSGPAKKQFSVLGSQLRAEARAEDGTEKLLMATLVTPTEKAEKMEKNVPPTPEEKTDRKQRARVDEKFKIFSGTANEPLADEA